MPKQRIEFQLPQNATTAHSYPHALYCGADRGGACAVQLCACAVGTMGWSNKDTKIGCNRSRATDHMRLR